jgi:hypothetical protein
MRTSEWIRYQDDLWIPYRKRTFLYWFKFLQEAERFDEVKVDWRKYRGWGGANVILGQKFDHWWGDRWKDLFGSEVRWTDPSKIKFPLSTTRPKSETLRMSLLIWQLRDTPPDWRPRKHSSRAGTDREIQTRGSNAIAIGWKLHQTEKRNTYGKTGVNPEAITDTYVVKRHDAGHQPDNYDVKDAGYFGTTHQVQQYVGRWKRRGRQIINNVCEGRFP